MKERIIKKSEKYPNIVKNLLEKGKKLNEEWENNNENINSKINKCINIENSVKEIKDLDENIKKYNSQKIEIKFITQKDDFQNIISKINEYGEINDNSDIFRFKFKEGQNYSVSENGLTASKTSEGTTWDCSIFGDKEIPKNRISKWKIKLNEIGSCYIIIWIGPQNPNNKSCFYQDCWSFLCYDSKKVIKSSSQSDYNGHAGQLKKGDIVEVIVDRKSWNLSFAVNDIDYGIAHSEIPKDDTLYPVNHALW